MTQTNSKILSNYFTIAPDYNRIKFIKTDVVFYICPKINVVNVNLWS